MFEILKKALRGITAAKLAQDALQESKDYLNATINSSAGGFYSVDCNGSTTVCNKAFLEMLGFERMEDAIGKKLHDVIHHTHPDGSHYPKEECPIYQAAQTGKSAHVEDELFFRLDGTSFPVEYWTHPIIRNGEVRGAVTTFIDISERKRSEEERQRLAAVVESTTDFVGMSDPELNPIFVNRAGRKLSGLGDRDVTKTPIIDYFPKELHQRFKNEVIPILKETGYWEGELLFQHFETGKLIPVLYNLFRVKHQKSGQTIAYATVTRDITEQKRSEVEMTRLLQEANSERQRLLTMLEQMPAGVILAEASGKLILRNPQMDQMLGGFIPAQNIEEYGQYVGYKPDGSPYLPNDWPLARSLTSGETVRNEEVDFLLVDGSRHTFSLSSSPVRDENENVIAGVVVCLDVTEQKRTEKALIESEEMARIALSAGQMGDWDLDLVTGIAHRSLRHDQCFGYQTLLPSWTYENFLHHLYPEDRESVDQKFKNAIKEGSDWRFECRVTWPDQSVHWIAASGRATLGTSGEPLRMAGLVQDITERKLTEEALKEAVRARDEFISICSHELKTPITSMKLQFQIAERMLKKGDKTVFSEELVERRVLTANRQLDRMANLIEEMLDVSRIGAGRLQMNFAALDLADLSREVMERFSEQFLVLGLPVEFVVKPERIPIVGDLYRLEQVLSNLLTNAIKYGSGSAISVTVTANHNTARLMVQDGGVGIAKDNLSRIFQRFERAISASNVSGLGLGLYITSQIVEAHQGRIWAESEVGHGSTFIVEIPFVAIQK